MSSALGQNGKSEFPPGGMKPIVCVFAHPDDEAFGPGGTIAKLAKTRDVYLICATKGEEGKHKGAKGGRDLGKIRADELLRSAKLLGIKKVFLLGFRDGTLSNNLYHKLSRKIEAVLKRLKPDAILTYEPRGVSGHIDHITVSMVSSYVFQRLPFVRTLMQFCIPAERARGRQSYFVYFPPGYKKSEIDHTINVRDVWDVKVKAMMQHESQIHDIERILKRAQKFPKVEHFLIQLK